MSENVFAEDFGVVRLDRTAVRSLSAGTASLERSAVQRLAGDQVQANSSALGMANASTIEMHEGAIGVAVGDYIRVEDSSVFVLLAPRVSGNVRAVLTVQGAFAFGVGFYLARRVLNAYQHRHNS